MADTLVSPMPCTVEEAETRDYARAFTIAIGGAPFVLAQIRHGLGVMQIATRLLVGWRQATAPAVWAEPLALGASAVYGASQ